MHPSAPLPVTERLLLRRLTMDDLDMHCELNSDPEVTRYVGGTMSREQVVELLSIRVIAYYDEHPGLGAWATLERTTGNCVGVHLLNHISGESHIQVGYILFRRYWGLGYATEMAVGLLRYGFEQLNLAQITAITDLPHEVSKRVLQKAGLHRKGERSFAHPRYEGASYAWFERDAADWLAEDRADTRDCPSSSARILPA